MPRLILASDSPRRKELLATAGYRFEVISPSADAEDDRAPAESPTQYVARMARQKAESVARRVVQSKPFSSPAVTIVGCDTIVVCAGQILGKPADPRQARQMLQTLRGTEHHAVSGLCIVQLPEGECTERVETTTLRMAAISDAALSEYLESGLWRGKAGGFGYQDRTGWLEIVAGSETNVVGLPLETLTELLGPPERKPASERL